MQLNAPVPFVKRKTIRAYIDLYFNPDVSRFGQMDWAAFDKIVEKGYEHEMIVLKSLSDEDRATFWG